jgi:hypothetical protein
VNMADILCVGGALGLARDQRHAAGDGGGGVSTGDLVLLGHGSPAIECERFASARMIGASDVAGAVPRQELNASSAAGGSGRVGTDGTVTLDSMLTEAPAAEGSTRPAQVLRVPHNASAVVEDTRVSADLPMSRTAIMDVAAAVGALGNATTVAGPRTTTGAQAISGPQLRAPPFPPLCPRSQGASPAVLPQPQEGSSAALPCSQGPSRMRRAISFSQEAGPNDMRGAAQVSETSQASSSATHLPPARSSLSSMGSLCMSSQLGLYYMRGDASSREVLQADTSPLGWATESYPLDANGVPQIRWLGAPACETLPSLPDSTGTPHSHNSLATPGRPVQGLLASAVRPRAPAAARTSLDCDGSLCVAQGDLMRAACPVVPAGGRISLQGEAFGSTLSARRRRRRASGSGHLCHGRGRTSGLRRGSRRRWGRRASHSPSGSQSLAGWLRGTNALRFCGPELSGTQGGTGNNDLQGMGTTEAYNRVRRLVASGAMQRRSLERLRDSEGSLSVPRQQGLPANGAHEGIGLQGVSSRGDVVQRNFIGGWDSGVHPMVGTLRADRVGASRNVEAGLRGGVQAAQGHLQTREVVDLHSTGSLQAGATAQQVSQVGLGAVRDTNDVDQEGLAQTKMMGCFPVSWRLTRLLRKRQPARGESVQ